MRLVRLLTVVGFALANYTSAQDILDSAPDLSKSKRVYPALDGSDNVNATGGNWRGTHLFGFDGCGGPQQTAIIQAYNDMYKLANAEGVGSKIDWNSDIAKDFFGAATGKYTIPDERRKQIQHVFAQVAQLWARWFELPVPFHPGFQLWIWVRCSGADNSGDPEDGCKDKEEENPDDRVCGVPPNRRPLNNEDNRMQAYSEPLGVRHWLWKYTRVTFCRKFFEVLPSMDEVIQESKSDSWTDEEKHTLVNYDNQARCFIHEATHWNYFVDAPGRVPYVDDLTMKIRKGGNLVSDEAYGPENCKILTNYRRTNKGGFYTQQNADSFAWFAMANYIQKQNNLYPELPRTNIAPAGPPRDGDGQPLFADAEPDTPSEPAEDDAQAVETRGKIRKPQPAIGCNGKWGGNGPARSLQMMPPVSAPECDLNQASVIPANLFTEEFYEPLCTHVREKGGNGDPLLVEVARSVNAKNEVTSFPKEPDILSIRSLAPFFSRIWSKRAPPSNPDSYPNARMIMKWTPGKMIEGDSGLENLCNRPCMDAFKEIVQACGAAGNSRSNLAQQSSIDIGCGKYTLDVVQMK